MLAFLSGTGNARSAPKPAAARSGGGGGWERLFAPVQRSPAPATKCTPAATGQKKRKLPQSSSGELHAVTSAIGRAAARPGLEQTYIDLGQRNFARTVECRECGFVYTEGEPTDEAAHRQHHRRALQGVRVRGALAELRVVAERLDGYRVVLLQPSDGADALRKLSEVRALLDSELGTVTRALPDGLRALLLLEAGTGRVSGCVFAEPIAMSHRAVCQPANAGEPSIRTTSGGADDGRGDGERIGGGRADDDGVLTHDGGEHPAMCGISHIWIHAGQRRRGFARQLLDLVRAHFATGFEVPRTQLAFSQPTALGRRLAAAYSATDAFLVYD